MSDSGEEIGTSSSSKTTEDTSSNSKTTEDSSSGSKTIEDTSSSSKTTEDLQEPDNLCNICYEPIKQPVKIRGCLHEFDWECIERWMYGIGNRLCPMCRGEICVQNPYTSDCPQTRPPSGYSWQYMEPGSEERRQEYIRFMLADIVHQYYFSEEALRHRPGAREAYLRWLEDTSYLHLYDEPPTEEEMLPGRLILGSLDDWLPETDYGEESDDLRESNETEETQESEDAHEAIEDGIEEHYVENDYNEDPDNEDGDLMMMLMAEF